MKQGCFYGVGVGPGDPELITVKAKKILERAEIVCFPLSKVERESLAYEIARKAVPRLGRPLGLLMPMTRERQELSERWERAAREVIGRLTAGNDVAFVTLGDPTLYSTFVYLQRTVERLLPGVRTQVVPGVSALTACAARAGVALATGDETVAVLTASAPPERLHLALQNFDTVVIIKAGPRFDRLLPILREAGVLEGARFVSRCGLDDEMLTDRVETLEGRPHDYLSMLIVHTGRAGDGE